jgi:hypothetical protein
LMSIDTMRTIIALPLRCSASPRSRSREQTSSRAADSVADLARSGRSAACQPSRPCPRPRPRCSSAMRRASCLANAPSARISLHVPVPVPVPVPDLVSSSGPIGTGPRLMTQLHVSASPTGMRRQPFAQLAFTLS